MKRVVKDFSATEMAKLLPIRPFREWSDKVEVEDDDAKFQVNTAQIEVIQNKERSFCSTELRRMLLCKCLKCVYVMLSICTFGAIH